VRRILFLAALSTFPSLAHASDKSTDLTLPPGSVGIGVIVGAPTGIDAKIRLDKSSSIDAAVGLGFYAGLDAFADYLYEGGDFWKATGEDAEDSAGAHLAWYIGAGGRFFSWRNSHDHGVYEIGARVPVGIELGFETLKPLELFFEVAPGVVIVEHPGVSVDADVGVRWFF
jgi:hypothetical protein